MLKRIAGSLCRSQTLNSLRLGSFTRTDESRLRVDRRFRRFIGFELQCPVHGWRSEMGMPLLDRRPYRILSMPLLHHAILLAILLAIDTMVPGSTVLELCAPGGAPTSQS